MYKTKVEVFEAVANGSLGIDEAQKLVAEFDRKRANTQADTTIRCQLSPKNYLQLKSAFFFGRTLTLPVEAVPILFDKSNVQRVCEFVEEHADEFTPRKPRR